MDMDVKGLTAEDAEDAKGKATTLKNGLA